MRWQVLAKLNLAVLATLVAGGSAFAASVTPITYQARILKPDGTPLESMTNFRFTIRSPTGCILWMEDRVINMANSKGALTALVGDQPNLGSGSHPFSDVFNNSKTLNSLTECDSGTSYVPGINDDRQLFVSFNDGTVTNTVPAIAIKNVPYSTFAAFAQNTVRLLNRVIDTSVDPTTTGQVLVYNAGSEEWELTTLAGGSVTSVGLSLPGSLFTVTASPVTGAGTLTATLANQVANQVFAGPTSGVPGTPSFRSLVAADIPSLDASSIGSGTFASARVPDLDAGKITTGTLATARLGMIPPSSIEGGVGLGSVTSVSAGAGLAGGNITTSGTLSLAPSGVTAGSLGTASRVVRFLVDTYGRLTGADELDIAIDGVQVVSGTLATARLGVVPDSVIEGVAASKLTGTLNNAQVGVINNANIESLAASKLTGTLSAAQLGTVPAGSVENLDASKITSGTFANARIGVVNDSNISGLAASKLIGTLNSSTVGVIDGSQLVNIAASTVTSGTFDNARLGTIPNASIESLAASKLIGTLNTSSLGLIPISSIEGGAGLGSVTNVSAGTGLAGGNISTTGTISLATSGVSAGSLGTASRIVRLIVDTYGRITGADEQDIAINANQLTAGTLDNARVGIINDSNISGLAASKLTGTLNSATIGTIDGSQLTNIAASSITSGTLATARLGTVPDSVVESLSASKLTGTLNNAQVGVINNANIGDLAASKLTGTLNSATVGTINGSQLVNIAASTVTSGTFDTARLGIIPISSIEGGAGLGSVTNVSAGTGLAGGNISTTGTISLATSGVSAGSLGTASRIVRLIVDTYGRITGADEEDIAINASQLTAGTLDNARVGIINDSNISGLAASKLTGTLNSATIGTIDGSQLTNIAGSSITSGTLATARLGTVPDASLESLSASKLTGTLNNAQVGVINDSNISGLAAAKLTGTLNNAQVGVINNANINDLAASKLSGTLNVTTMGVIPLSAIEGGAGLGSVTNVSAGAGLTGGNITGSGTIALANSGVTAGSLGTASRVARFIVDAFGRITGADDVNIAVDGSQVTSGTLANARIGVINDSNISALAASKLTGTLNSATIGTIDGSQLSNIAASSITSGTLETARLGTVPDSALEALSASKLTGTLNNAQVGVINDSNISGLAAGKLTGTLNTAQVGIINDSNISSLAAGKLTGTLSVAQMGTTNVGTGSVGGAGFIPTISFDAFGRIVSVGSTAIAVNDAGFSGILSPGKGGTGLDGSAASNGQLLIGNGTGYSLGNLYGSNGLTVTNYAGSIALSTNAQTTNAVSTIVARDVSGNFAANVATLNGLSLNNAGSVVQISNPIGANYSMVLPANMGTPGQVLITNGTSALTWTSAATGTVTQVVAGTGLAGGTINTVGTLSLATSGVTPGTINSNTYVPTMTVDTYGRITALGSTAISFPADPWTTIGLGINYASGSVGIGVGAPAVKLDISGAIRIANETASCAAGFAGAIRYNGGNLEYCNGSGPGWQTLGVSGAGLQSINGQNDNNQSIVVVVSGTSAGIASANGTHSINIPMASTPSATGGLLSNADYLTLMNGTIPAGRVADLDAAKITSGTLANARIGTINDANISALAASKLTGTLNSATIGTIDGSSVTNIAAGSITSGTLATARLGTIPNSAIEGLAASKLTGTLNNAQVGVINNANIANLDAGKVTTGTFDLARLGNIPASQIVGGATGSVTYVGTGAGLTGGNFSTTGTISLAASGVTAGSLGTVSRVVRLIVDTYGRITGADEQDIAINASQVTAGTLTNARIGTINDSNISGLAASKLTGTLNSATIGTIDGSSITNVAASSITSGTLATVRLGTVPNSAIEGMAASKLTGTLNNSTVGTINDSNISGLAGTKLSGTVNVSNLPASGVVAQTVGSGSSIPTLTIDSAGRITAVGSSAISQPWSSIGLGINYASGSVGIGVGAPAVKLDISGAIRIANETASCAAGFAGAIRYNAGALEYCNGSGPGWQTLGVSGAGLQSINGLTQNAQVLVIATTGTSPAVVSLTGTHSINIPMASTPSATAGLLSNADYLTLMNGTIPAGRVADLDAAKITSGTLANARIGTINDSNISGLAASKLTGTLNNAQVGVINNANIANLDAGKVTSGTFDLARLGNIPASQIVGGSSGSVTYVGTGAGLTGGNFSTAGTISLSTSGVTAGSLGTVSRVVRLIVDTYGRITGADEQDIAINASQVSAGTLANARIGTINDSNISGLAASKLTGTLAVSVLGAPSFGFLTGTISSAQLGTINGSSITNIAASSITSGSLALARVGTIGNANLAADLDASKIASGTFANARIGVINDSNISGLAASKLTGTLNSATIGTIDGSSITNVAASSITSGTLATVRLGTVPNSAIEGMAASKLTGTLNNSTVGVINDANINDLAASKLSGTLAIARLPASGVVAQTVGSGSSIPTLTIDSAGRITAVGSSAISQPWSSIGLGINYASGSVGIGVGAPAVKLDISGAIRIANETASCAAGFAGAIRYNAGALEYCNGSGPGWQTLGVSGAGLQSINGLTQNAQVLVVSTSGTSPTVVSLTGTHSINIPMASTPSATAGLLSNADYLTLMNGTIPAGRVADLDAAKITSGTFANARIGTINDSNISGLAASKLTGTLAVSALGAPSFGFLSGTISSAQLGTINGSSITNIAASSITSGSLALARVGTIGNANIAADLDASKVASGTFALARLGNIPASQIVGGSSGSVTYVGTGAGLTGGNFSTTGTLSLAASGVTAGSLGTVSRAVRLIVDTYGRITGADEQDIAINASQVTAGTLANARIGTINDSNISDLAASKLTGTLTVSSLGAPSFSFLSGTISSAQLGTINGSSITNIAASSITSGSLALVRVGTIGNANIAADLDASKIASGTFANARIGVINDSNISGLAASKLTGTLPVAQMGTMNIGSGSVGSSGFIPQLGFDQYGRITSVGSTAIAGLSYPLLSTTRGSVGSPVFSFSADSDTGLYSPGAGTLALSTNGTMRLTVNDAGRVGIGTGTANYTLSVEGSLNVNGSQGYFTFDPNAATWSSMAGSTSIYTNGANTLIFSGGFNSATRLQGYNNVYPVLLQASGGSVAVGTTAVAAGARFEVIGGAIRASQQSAALAGEIQVAELLANGTNTVAFRSPAALANSYTMQLPSTIGSAGQVLATDGTGALSWTNPSAGVTYPLLSTTRGSAGTPVYSFSADSDTGIFSPGANTLGFSTAGTLALNIGHTGRVGIGTNAPEAALDVRGKYVGDGIQIRSEWPYLYLDSTAGTDRRAGINFSGAGGSHLWEIATDFPENNTQDFFIRDRMANQVRFHIDSQGRVGLGTTTSAAGTRLDVVGGAIRASQQSASAAGEVQFAELLANGTNTIALRAPSSLANSLTFQLPSVAGTVGHVLTLTGTGTLGFAAASGGTSFPLLSTTRGSAGTPVYSFSADSDSGIFSPGANSLAISTAGTTRVTITEKGYIGLGTTSPEDYISILAREEENAIVSLQAPTPWHYSELLFKLSNGGHVASIRWSENVNEFSIGASNSAPILFHNYSQELMRIQSSGQVGIGTTAAASGARLDVVGGAIRASQQSASLAGEIQVAELLANGTNTVAFRAPSSLANSLTFQLPSVAGTVGHVLTLTGTGTMGWAAASSGVTYPLLSTTRGSAATPAYSFSADSDTGVFSPGTNTLALSTAGTSRINIDSVGRIGVGESAPNASIHLAAPVPSEDMLKLVPHPATGGATTVTVDAWGLLRAPMGVEGQGIGFQWDNPLSTGVVTTSGAWGLVLTTHHNASTSSQLITIGPKGETIAIGTTAVGSGARAQVGGALRVGQHSSSVGGEVQFAELLANGTNTVAFRAPSSLASSFTFELPTVAGTVGHVLTLTGSGTMGWAAVSGSTSFPLLSTTRGSAATPAYSFSADSDTGLLSPGPGATAIAGNGTTWMHIGANGNVGIGTGTPLQKLHVYQNTNADVVVDIENDFSGRGAYLALLANSLYSSITFGGSTQQWYAGLDGTSTFEIKDGTNSRTPFAIQSNAPTNSLFINSGGSIGVGTAAPSGKFSVGGAANENVYLFYDNANVGDANNGQSLYLYRRAAEGDGYIRAYIDQYDYARVEADNHSFFHSVTNFTNPNFTGTWPEAYNATEGARSTPRAFHLNIENFTPTNGAASGIHFTARNTANVWPYQSAYIYGVSTASGSSAELVFGQRTTSTSTAERMRLDANGNLGVGTTTPGAKLDVNGDVKFGSSGTVVSNMGVCTVASYTPTSTTTNQTCTGIPASTAVAVTCSASAAFQTPNTTVIYARATGTANQLAINLSAANNVAVTLKCMWMQ